MGFTELFLIAIGLSMDAFAVSICKGLATGKVKVKHMLVTGFWFGFFQMLMPLLGYLLAKNFSSQIEAVDHWIAFALLAIIGANMIREGVKGDEEESSSSYSPSGMFPLAIATSIDALAIGVSFAFLSVDIIPAVSTIGICTFILSAIGVRLGSSFGAMFKGKAEIAGGVILILIGLKILLEHLGIFA